MDIREGIYILYDGIFQLNVGLIKKINGCNIKIDRYSDYQLINDEYNLEEIIKSLSDKKQSFINITINKDKIRYVTDDIKTITNILYKNRLQNQYINKWGQIRNKYEFVMDKCDNLEEIIKKIKKEK